MSRRDSFQTREFLSQEDCFHRGLLSLQGSSGLRRTSEIIEIARTSTSYIPVSDFLFDRDLRTLGNAESSSVSSTEIVFWTDVSLCSVYYTQRSAP
jgi:hypothetical protein